MNRLLEYTTQHPFLVTAAALLAILAIVIEMRERAKGSSLVGAADAVRLVNGGALVLDVRDTKDYEAGHIIDARSIPVSEVGKRVDNLKKYKEKPVIVYCESGLASATAAKTLKAQGFNKVAALRGGLRSWRQENLPVVKGTPKKDGKQT